MLSILGDQVVYPAMQRSIAIVIATIIGMGPSSGYLWTHLFQPEMLKDTYIPGFLVRYFIITMMMFLSLRIMSISQAIFNLFFRMQTA